MKNLPILVCLACVALSLSLDLLGEEIDRYRENLRMLNKLTDGDGLEKMRVLLGSEEFDRLISDLKPILGGSSDPDNQFEFDGDMIDPDFSIPVLDDEETDLDDSGAILGGDNDPDHSRLILGGDDDPDHSRPILGGDDDPDNSRLILGGDDDPDHSSLILGGDDDPDHSRLILGGDDDPDHPAYSNPTSESFVTEVSSKPMAIVGGTDDPDHTRLSLFLGGEDDPDHSRFSQDDTADETTFGEESDPDLDTRVTTDLEENEMADYPGKFERRVPKSGNIKPIRGRSPAKQQNKKESHDIPVDVDPCLPSLPDPRSEEEVCETAECPQYQVVEVEGTCGFELRRYNKGVWVMTQMDTKKGINEAFIDASEKLTKYMNGENDAKEVMDATRPQTVVFVMKDKNTPKVAFLSQFLPLSQHENPPQPSEGHPLIVKHNPEMLYYVRTFGGEPSIDRYRREFGMLAAAIQKSGLNAVWTMRFFHEYSHPQDKTQRHEVAVMVAPSES